jgi:hypothetical protein
MPQVITREKFLKKTRSAGVPKSTMPELRGGLSGEEQRRGRWKQQIEITVTVGTK